MRTPRITSLTTAHPDYAIIARIEAALLSRVGGLNRFKSDFPKLVRQAIDEVIDTTRTGRVHASELEKTEKTYIGTKVEIIVRNYFRLPKGILDLQIDGLDVDVKNTLGNNWMIPREAVGKPCILVSSNENLRTCSFGIMVMHLHHLTAGTNQDLKRSVSSQGYGHVHWLLADESYPPSFWSLIGDEKTHAIMRGLNGNERIAALFREAQGMPIHRDIIQSVAQQKDYMKRLRKNGGARDDLEKEGIAILSAKYDAPTIEALGLPQMTADEFVSVSPTSAAYKAILRASGHLP